MYHKVFRSFFALILVIGLMTLYAPQSARATGPWYVATTGDDSNDCLSSSTPCATINGAIAKAVDGDTIKVAVGTYTGSGTEVVRVNKDVALSGGWDAVFANQNGVSVVDGENSRLGVYVGKGGFSINMTASLDRFIIKNGNNGGISNNYADLTITNSSIQNNSGNNGGGIRSNIANLTLNNITISNNLGNGLKITSGIININNTTISNNSIYTGGGINNAFATVQLNNSIISGNIGTSDGPDCYGSITSLGNNIIGDTTGCNITAASGDQFNVDPQLSLFLPEQGYYPLVSGSPAINAGNSTTCLLTDQRGVSRVGTCDIGAYEYTTAGSAVKISVADGNNQQTAPTFAFQKLLKAVVLDSQGTPVSGVNITFTAPASGASGTFADAGTNVSSVNTDANGVATASVFTANDQLGSYIVEASGLGLVSGNFNLKNLAWFVATTGNDSNSCITPASPCLTISGAIEKPAFASGDTILVAEGIYFGNPSARLTITEDANLLGGWDESFTSQLGFAILDGQNNYGLITFTSNTISYVEHFIFQNGQASGISNSGTLTIDDSIIQGNSASKGGGIFNSGNLILNNVSINNNMTQSQTSQGGGIYNTGTLVLNNSTVSGNTSLPGYTSYGIANINGSVILDNSTVSGNTGGILNNNSGLVTMNNSTVSGNFAEYSGGGINSNGTVILNNSTISGNIAGDDGGGIRNGGTLTLQNSILDGNTSIRTGPEWFCYGAVTSLGNNIIGDTTGCVFTPATGDLTNVDAGLGPLADNGGPTFTHALLAGSPAINAGNPTGCTDHNGNLLATDQRGTPRPQGAACDIGAFEYELAMIDVSIDIKPGSDTNPINPNSRGKIPVAILSTVDFDAPSMLDTTSLTFGKTGDESSLAFCNNGIKDVNEDGLFDLICHFYTQATGFQIGDLEGILKGENVEGTPMEGRDVVTILD